MKAKILIIIFLSTFSLIGKSQNLISNNSFESGPISKPSGVGQLFECNNWTSLTAGVTPCGVPDGSTPDWYKSVSPFFRMTDISNSIITAHTGIAFVGTGSNGEIIQQKLSNKLQTGLHVLKMFVRRSSIKPVPPCTFPLSPDPNLCTFFFPCNARPHLNLNIFLSKDKIEYLDLNTGNVKKNNLQPTVTMNLPTTEMTDWIEVKIEIVVKEDDIEWIGIEGVDARLDAGIDITNDFKFYTLIDDVSLEKKSIEQCKACGNVGAIDIGVGNMNQGQPLRFVRLKNVTDFELKVYTSPQSAASQGNAIRTIRLKNPPCDFTYNHRDDAGNVLPVIQYTYVYRASNDCAYKKVQFFSSNDVTDLIGGNLPPNSDISAQQSFNKFNPLDNCCKDQLDLKGSAGGTYLSNLCLFLETYISTIPLLPKLTLKARKNIVVNDIITLKNTDLIAPVIVLNGKTSNGMTILDGTFIQRNDCPPPPVLLQKFDDNYAESVENKSSFKDDIIMLNDETTNLSDNDYSFNLYPNPTSGEFSLIIKGLNVSKKYDINITDLQGKNVYTNVGYVNVNKNIDLGFLAKGIYFVKAVVGDKVFFQKISKI